MLADGSNERYADRYDTWLSTATHPRMVSNVFLVDAESGQLRLRRWNPDTRKFEPIAWPTTVEKYRPQFEQERKAYDAATPGRPRLVIRDDALIVRQVDTSDGPPGQAGPGGPGGPGGQAGPAALPGANGQGPRAPFGFSVIELNLDYIFSQMLPELTQRHFARTDSDGYRVSVVTADTPSRVLYRSEPDAPTDPAQADVRESLYPPGPLGFFFRPPRDDASPVTINVIEGQDGSQTQLQNGRWRLLVQHQSGSLEAAVGQVRRRNLAISFGVLLLLSFSVGMLMLTSRRAERLARQQMEFVAGISHELRTPVAVIKSAAENLSQGVVGSVDRVKRYGNMIEGEARRLGEMVERVLQYAAIESGLGMGSRTTLAPEEIIQGAIDSSMPLLSPDNVQIHRDIGLNLPAVFGDANALRSAVQNLIANAVKYGGADHWVGIRAEHVRDRRHGEVRITVSDHGNGIDAAELPHIFEPFYRGADAVAQQIHGNGLGLSLVRRIVEAHGGKVSATSRPGSGSAFTITLPAAEGQAATASASALSTAPQA